MRQFAFALALLTVVYADIILSPVPVPLPFYRGPSTIVPCAFRNESTDTDAEMIMETKAPTVNLVNIMSIRSINCETRNGRVQLNIVFTSVNEASLQLTRWSAVSGLVLLSPARNCGTESLNPLLVRTYSAQGSLLSMQVEPVLYEDLLEEYEITASSPYQTNSAPLGTDSFPPFEESNVGAFSAEIKSQASLNSSDGWVQPQGQSSAQNANGIFLGLNFNYNFNTEKARTERIEFIANNNNKVSCVGCYAVGGVRIRINMRIRWFRVQSWEVSFLGDIGVKFFVEYELRVILSRELFNRRFFELPVGAITVPGLFTIGPNFALDIIIEAEIQGAIKFGAGFEARVPFDLQFTSGDPTPQRTGVHKLIPPSINLEVGLALIFKARFSFGPSVSAFRRDVLALRIFFDQAFGYASVRGTDVDCPAGGVARRGFYTQQTLGAQFRVFSADRALTFDTDKRWSTCCSRCLYPPSISGCPDPIGLVGRRVDCGFVGIDRQGCERRNCCWNPVSPNPRNSPWCFYRDGDNRANTISSVFTGQTDASVASPPACPDPAHVRPGQKVACGWPGISQDNCTEAGCCYAPSTDLTPWCYKVPVSCPRKVPSERKDACGGRLITQDACDRLGCCWMPSRRSIDDPPCFTVRPGQQELNPTPTNHHRHRRTQWPKDEIFLP